MSGTSAGVREAAAIVICVTIVAVHATMEAAFGREYDGTGTKTRMISWQTRHFGVIITVVPIVSSAQGLNPVIRYGTMAASNPSSSSTSRSMSSSAIFSHFLESHCHLLFCHCAFSAILPLCHFAIERFQEVICQSFFVIVILPLSGFKSTFNCHCYFSSFSGRSTGSSSSHGGEHSINSISVMFLRGSGT